MNWAGQQAITKWYRSPAPSMANMENAYEWCKEQQSPGRFHQHVILYWLFEFEEDALMFALRWSR